MSALPTPVFVDLDVTAIQNEMVAFYEASTGKTLRPGQPETLLINSLAYREFLFRYKVNEAAKQNLVSFATAPVLDYLGELVGVVRLPASNAVCSLELTFISSHAALVIPAGFTVASADGMAIFATDVATEVEANVETITVGATCLQSGETGNSYLPGSINLIQSPQLFLLSASNVETTNGGGSAETDIQLRERIKLASSIFSVAGPSGAYEYWAKTASPNIVDVKVRSVVPGRVEIFPLMESGETPQAILDKVFDICDDVKVRPLTDTPLVIAPTAYEYTISVNLTILPDADPDIEHEKAITALTKYADEKRSKLGLDLVPTKIKQDIASDGLYDAQVVSPSSNVVLGIDQYAECVSLVVNIVGISEP
jgi:phage-related baseplate assembly protein